MDERLVRVVKRAIELTSVDFMVVEGVRTREQCRINYGKGRTATECLAKGIPASYARPGLARVTWLNNPYASKHVTGLAVDLLPAPYDWKNLANFDAVAKAMFAAAKELGIAIRSGADWDADGKPRERGETDSPHFELA
ncbi:M15 family metallopeptidase [Sphingomonas xinjiangensis]|uniref:M15 family metallopeptidase n=1 Tax=Sphingomonas xinjiangensis TaxID=643568 RepID=UPI001C846788